ncbi:MAG: inositol monophosphatase family protein, partial [Actinomycetota bacterium]
MTGLVDLAAGLARRAGLIALEGRRGGDLGESTKSSPTDIVTRFDRLCEREIVDGLMNARPDDAIVGEEGASRTGTSGVAWHIDPIDGTANYFFGLPTWSVSVGACDADGPLAGAVYLPVLDEMFTASRGGGAFLNGARISPRGVTAVADALLGTGFGYDPAARAAHGRTVA